MKEQPSGQYKPAEKLELRDFNMNLPKSFKKITCPSCENNVISDNLNLQKSLAKCGSCNVIFSIEDEVELVSTKEKAKQEIIRPEGIDLFYYKNDLDITIQQHIQGIDAFGIGIFPIAALFAIFLVFAEGVSIYYPVILSFIAMFFIYRIMNYSKNKTYIDIDEEYMTIKSRPKNFKKDRAYSIKDIDQIYLFNNGSGYLSIQMIINGIEGQKHVKLLSVNSLSKAKFLEQEIEKYLKIENRKVPEGNVT